MINAKLLRNEGILVMSLVDTLQVVDFERLRLLADPYIERQGGINGLLIDVESFQGWEDFTSLLSHLRFVGDYQKSIKRVAMVTDSNLLAVLPKVANHFIAAEVRHFDYQDRDKALIWLQIDLKDPK